MIINSHILFSKILYKHCKNNLNFKLDKRAFMYGNIKPDLECDHSKEHHTLGETISDVNGYCDKLLEDNLSIKEFSMVLGMVCHFTCDYFCLYHREENKYKNIFEHLLYEVILHIFLRVMLLLGYFNKFSFEPVENEKPIMAILRIRDEYLSLEKSFMNDLRFAVGTATLVSSYIVNKCSVVREENVFSNEVVLIKQQIY